MVKVKNRIKRGTAILLSAVMMLCSAGCTGGGSGGEDPTFGGYTWKDSTEVSTEFDPSAENKKPKSPMTGPDTPPQGMRYDEWKNIEYTTELSLPVKSSWNIQVYDKTLPSLSGYTLQNPVIDGKLTFTDAKAEPVGGEMQLRSGGYVDITIEMEVTGALVLEHDDSYRDCISYMIWQDLTPTPCDAYTGTSLINYSDDEEADDHELSVGQAMDSGLVESDVTFQNRTYRLFAGQDMKNSTFGGYDYDYRGGKTITTLPTSSTITIKARIPADYDGLILAIEKDISGRVEHEIDAYGNSVLNKDLYADMLTEYTGDKHNQDFYYFVRVSDLLEIFSEK